MQKIFKPYLLPDLISFPNTNQAVVFSQTYQKDAFQVAINYGKIANNLVLNKEEIVLDIDLFCIENRRDQTQETFEIINDEIFNIFCWALSDEALSKISYTENANV